jgi:hypothetical protein
MHKRSLLFLSTAFWLIPCLIQAAERKPAEEITPENWEHHPRIMEVRKLYNEIQSLLTQKKLKYQKKDYTVLPRSCRGTYPMEYLVLAEDTQGRVRLHTTAQRISHDDLLTTQYFYDPKGILRFAYITNKSSEYATIEYRVYLTDQGKVFWDTRTEAKKTTFGETTKDPWMVRVVTAAQARTDFNEAEVKCRE